MTTCVHAQSSSPPITTPVVIGAPSAGSTPQIFGCGMYTQGLGVTLCRDYGITGIELDILVQQLGPGGTLSEQTIRRYRTAAEASQFAPLARSVYEQFRTSVDTTGDGISDWDLDLDLSRRELWSGFGAATYVRRSSTTSGILDVAIVFEGTGDLPDWASNLSVLSTVLPRCGLPFSPAPPGCDPQFSPAANYVDSVYQKYPPSSVTRMTFVGHSLGGRLAQIFAARSSASAMTFNSAAPANRIVAPSWNSRRVTNVLMLKDVVNDISKVFFMAGNLGEEIHFGFAYPGLVLDPHSMNQTEYYMNAAARVYLEFIEPKVVKMCDDRTSTISGDLCTSPLILSPIRAGGSAPATPPVIGPPSAPIATPPTIGAPHAGSTPPVIGSPGTATPRPPPLAGGSVPALVDELGSLTGNARYAAFSEALANARVPARLSAKDAVDVGRGMNEYHEPYMRLVAARITGPLTAAQANTLAADTQGLNRFKIVTYLGQAGLLRGPFSPADIALIVRNMELYRAPTISLLARVLTPNMGAREVISLFGRMSSPIRLATLSELKSAGRLKNPLSAEEVDAIAVTFGMFLEGAARDVLNGR